MTRADLCFKMIVLLLCGEWIGKEWGGGSLLQSVLEMIRMGPGRGQERWEEMYGSKTCFLCTKDFAKGLDVGSEGERGMQLSATSVA